MAFIRFFLLLSLFASCRSSRVFEAKAFPVTFEGDSLFFNGIIKEDIAYRSLLDVLLLSRELNPHKKISVSINHPTIFQIYQTSYIVYPGENITISIDEYGNTIFKIKGNEKRSREFLFQDAFQTLESKIRPQFPSRIKDYPIDTVLLFEQKVKSEIPAYKAKANALFDSLATTYHISNTFKILFKEIMENNQNTMLYLVYYMYPNVLKENNLYLQKQRELLPLFNNITEKQKIYLGAAYYIESIGEALMTTKINDIKNEEELKEAIDTVNNNFKALSRDFLLTKVVYTAFYRRVPLSKKVMRYYYKSCRDASYKSIVRNLVIEQKSYANQLKSKTDNRLISLADDKIHTLEEVIAQQKGKLILIDIWAAGWCMPCLKQYPDLKKLQQKFAGEKISFISLSLDRERIIWKLRNEELGIDPNYSYLFESFNNQSFLKKQNVESIPRYILIDQNGKIINADAPTPDTSELEKLIKMHL